jgi:multidrug efflux pump
VLAVLMVVLVIFAFLHSLRATVVASLAVPISLIGTCGIMYLLGYSLNNLSLMALTIATGFVVDDAIVMIENISRHLEMARNVSAQANAGEAGVKGAPAPGRSQNIPAHRIALKAAMAGASEIGFTIISLTVSLIAVLIPLLFMGDVVGRLFREFAVSLAITILLSAVVSLTLVPMMSARWLRGGHEGGGRFGAWVQRHFDRLTAWYDDGLQWVLDRQGLTLLIALGTLLLTALLYIGIPKGLFPTQATGQLLGRVQASQDVSYERMARLQQATVDALLRDPEVANIASIVGVDGANNTMLQTGTLLINLKQVSASQQPATMQRLEQLAHDVAGVQLYLQPTQDLTIDAESGPTQYRVSLEGADDALVRSWATRLAQAMAAQPALQHIASDASAVGPAVQIELDRDTAARLGITASSLDDALYSAFGQRIVSTIFTDTNQYRVILTAQPNLLTTPQSLALLHLKTSSGSETPLSAVARIREVQAPLQVTHVAQYPATTLGFDTAPGVALGDAVKAVHAAADSIHLPASVTLSFLGAAGAYQNSLANELWLILAAVVCVYIVLGVLYESYVHPLTILSTLPSAGVGALLALWITGNDLGVIGVIGIILLIGIVKKNAIMMIDFALEAERVEKKSPRESIHQAALLRLRPILMTTFAALFAAVPLMFGFGEGAELRRPLGLAIFGGLIVSQLLTLFTTPVIYLAFDRLGARFGSRHSAQTAGDASEGLIG